MVDATDGSSQAELRAVRGAMTRLQQLAAQRRNGEQPAEEHLVAFAEDLQEALTGQLAVVLELRPESIQYAHKDVLGHDLISRQLAQGLHGTGLRSLQVDPGVSEAELRRLADLLSTDWSHHGAFDLDFEATVWRLGFRSVHFDVEARSLTGREELSALPDEEVVRQLVMRLGYELVQDHGEALNREVGAVLRALRRFPADDEEPQPAADLSKAERGEIRKELDAIHADTDAPPERIGMVAFECLRNDPGGIGAADTARRLVRHIQGLMAAGNPLAAGELLRRPMMLVSGPPFSDWPHQDVVESELRTLLGSHGREAIGRGVRNPGTPPEDWAGLLFTLSQLASPRELRALFAWSSVLEERVQLQAVADGLLLLVERYNLSLKQLLGEVHAEDTAVVLLALSRRPDATLVEPILARLQASEDVVREAALVALRQHQSPRIKELIRKAVEDPALPVRLEALRYLTVFRDQAAGPGLLHRLCTLSDPGEGELKALAMAAGHILREQAVSELQDIAVGERTTKSEGAAEAALWGLRAAGQTGRQALDAIGRRRPELRDAVRRVEGGVA